MKDMSDVESSEESRPSPQVLYRDGGGSLVDEASFHVTAQSQQENKANVLELSGLPR
jgi:hypothetical protein